ncbi:MAG: hypothetical protein ABJA78_07790 [Ferruginibacter sp.]
MKKYFLFLATFIFFSVSIFSQNVGIGTATPVHKLDVTGNIHSSGNMYADGNVGIGTVNPAYKLQVNDGALAFFSTTDNRTWVFNYNSSNSYFQLLEDGLARMTIDYGGFVGIGTAVPSYRLDVAGSIHASNGLITDGSVSINGSAAINGSLTVHNGKGIAYNPNSSTELKIVPFTTGTFTSILPGNGLSAEGTFGIPGGFTTTPRVFVGDIDATGGTGGELYRVQLIVYGCTATSCKVRLLNTSPNPVNYSTTWNMVAIGN